MTRSIGRNAWAPNYRRRRFDEPLDLRDADFFDVVRFADPRFRDALRELAFFEDAARFFDAVLRDEVLRDAVRRREPPVMSTVSRLTSFEKRLSPSG